MLTEDDLKQIAEIFNLTYTPKERLRVTDGYVTEDDMVWWHAAGGPEHTLAGASSHLANIRNFPDIYSIKKPYYRIEYLPDPTYDS